MKIYPKHDAKHEEDKGFTAEEIRRGIIYLYVDVECVECGKIQSLANSGYDRKCVKCGGRTQ